MRDYGLSRFFFEMQDTELRRRFAETPAAVMTEYRLKPEVQAAVTARDMRFLLERTNPYLLRYFFGYIGMSDAEFLERIRAAGIALDEGCAHG